MISRFFIDRPIFATVLSVLITLIGFIALFALPIAQYPRITPPQVIVSISYPGASAQVVADTIGAPIEQQVNGIEGMLYMSSQSGNDGSYSLAVTFDVGTDLNTALVMVQNRVALAMPQLPIEAQNQGITIRKKTPDILMIVNLFSPSGRYDDIYLSNFATIYVKDELLRVDGVSDITYQGERDYSIRAWLDPQKMAAANVTAMDVNNAVLTQNIDAPAGRIGQPPTLPKQAFELPLNTIGRLTTPEQFGDIIVKVGGRPPVMSLTGKVIETPPTIRPVAGSPGSNPSSASNSSSSGTSPSGGTTPGSSGSPIPSSAATTATTPVPGQVTSTTTGGVTTAGGATTGGSVTGTTSSTPITGGGLTGVGLTSTDITAGAAATGGAVGAGSLSGGSLSNGPPSMASGILRLRDVVRPDRYYFRLRFDPAKLAERHLEPGAVVNALRTGPRFVVTEDADAPADKGKSLTWVAVLSSLPAPREQLLADTLLSPGGGKSVRLGDLVLGEGGIEHLGGQDELGIELGAQNYTLSCIFDGKPSVGLGVYQLPGTNALEVADRVRARMKELKQTFPDDVDYAIAYDTTPFIRDSVLDVLMTLLEAVVLVGIVVLFFLQDWRAMILPMIDVPVSLIGTFAVMAGLTAIGDIFKINALNFSLNNISLFGLVLAIGIVVDDAIVVLENIERLIATGLDARTATIKAMEEVTGPIVAVGLVLCAVFVPCAFLGGITGQFFRQFAITIAVSTVISAINAVTMTPSRAVLLFKTEDDGKKHHHKAEALPWWFFAFVGGLLTFWYSTPLLGYLQGALQYLHLRADWVPRPQSAEDGVGVPLWRWWLMFGAYFAPGAVAGGVLGWVFIRPVNAVLGRVFRDFNRAFDFMAGGYGRVVGKLLPCNALVLAGYAGLLGLTWWVFQHAPVGFIPQQDQGRLIVNVQLPDGASLERSQAAVRKVAEVARKTKGVAHTVGIAGLSFILQANSPNFASMFIVLDPFDQRQKPGPRDTAIMARLRKAWAEEVQEATVTVYGASPIPGLGVAGGFKLIVEDHGGVGSQALQDQLDSEDHGVIPRLRKVPGLNNVATQFRARTPQYFLDIDRSKVASLGCSLNDVNRTLDIFLGSSYVNSFNAFGRHWQVTLQAGGAYRDRIEGLNLFKVRNQAGQMVPLGTLVNPKEIGGPISVTRYNLSQAASVNGNIQTGFSTGDAINTVNKITAETLPRTTQTEWTELMFIQLRAAERAPAWWVFLLAVVAVFLALSALYESWSLPLAVILVVPLCLLCSVSGVRWTNRDVNIFVQIGLVVLVGLACKNAILIVEYARQLRGAGRTISAATVEASQLRLRPILMTSLAFILGVVPLVIASGAGAEMRRSLGTAVFSGMLGVTVFGIFLTPVFYFVLERLNEMPAFKSAWARRLSSGSVWIVTVVAWGLLGLLGAWVIVPAVGGSQERQGLLWVLIPGLCVAVGVLVIYVGRSLRAARATVEPTGPTDQSRKRKQRRHAHTGKPGQ
jgi:multidrug efflux pump